MKIALIHDHLAQNGGAENVVRAFCEIWPDAPIYVVVHDPNNCDPFFNTKDIRTSFIQKLPLGVRKYQWFLPLMPSAVESYDLSEYDVVLSSTSSFAKGVVTRPETMHVSYCHTPTRFLWSDTHSYTAEIGVNRFVKKLLPIFLTRIRMWDEMASRRVDSFISNSKIIQWRIKKYYDRESTIVYPPVNTEDFYVAEKDDIGDYFLAGGRLVPYKRFDLLIQAFNNMGKKLVIFGDGPAAAELKAMAASNVEFVGRVPDAQLKKLFAECSAFLNPQEEDFGITMIEAMAAGRPVIAYNKGGARDIVDHGETGILIDYQTWEDFANTIIGFDKHAFDPQKIRDKALTFELKTFKNTMKEFVESEYKRFIQSQTF